MMRLRMKVILVCLTVTVGLVLLNPHNLNTSHLPKFRQLLAGTDSLWRTSSVTHSQDLHKKDARELVYLQPLPHQTTRNGSTDRPEKKMASKQAGKDETELLTTYMSPKNASTVADSARKAIKLVKDTMQLQREIEEAATPRNFVDVPKVGAKISKLSPKPKMQMMDLASSSELNTPSALKLRAKKFAPDTALGKFMAEQNRRFHHIRRECAMAVKSIPKAAILEGIDGSAMALQSYSNLLLDRQNRITFCPVYKAASTSWSVNLLQMRGLWKRTGKKPELQRLLHQVFPRLSVIAGPMLTRNTIKFMIVRHPFERLVSCYRDKFEYARKSYYYTEYGEKMVRMFRPQPVGFTLHEMALMLRKVRTGVEKHQREILRGNPYAEPIGPTFSEFVQFIVTTQRDDEHWRPYYSQCAACFIDYDVVLKFERLHDESGQFIEFLNRTSEIEPRWDNLSNMGSSTSAVACHYFRQIGLDLVKALLEKYANDFIMYEYSGDEFVKCAKDYTEGATVVVKPRSIDTRNKLNVHALR